jgi:hypothetical protein
MQRFEYTATLRELVHLPGGARVTSQSVVYSTSSAGAGRARCSGTAWSRGWSAAIRLLRIELHPRDADFAPVRRSWQRAARARAARPPRRDGGRLHAPRPRGAPTLVPAPTVAPSTQWQSTTAE